MRLHDRKEAGKLLAKRLLQFKGRRDTLVLALPRGGVPVGFEIARELHLPLDVFLVRKLGLPGQEELAIGAIAAGGVRVLNENILSQLPVDPRVIDAVAAREERELERRYRLYRDDKPLPHIANRHIILVDDGLATGATMRAAIQALHEQSPKRITVAVPVAPSSVQDDLPGADEIVSLLMPEAFHSVSTWYKRFEQTTDEEVRALLNEADVLARAA